MEQDQDYGQNSLEQSTQSNPNWSSLKTLGDYSLPQPIATWNSVRGVWEKNEPSLLCEHWELFSATWQTSGMMRNGQAYELPMQVHRTTVSESSSSPTPVFDTPDTMPDMPNSGSNRKGQVAGLGNQAKSLLPTPVVNDMGAGKTPEAWDEWTEKTKAKHQNGNGHGASLNIELLPTPKALDGIKGNLKTSEERIAAGHFVDLTNVANDLALMGTPRANAATATPRQIDAGAPKGRIEDQVLTTNWGKFAPAIERWEQVLGRPAPAPTKPDGKEGAHRLSSKFTEWMMGLPDGWITDAGLTRNEELKACGNGVVPQQAELALRRLLA